MNIRYRSVGIVILFLLVPLMYPSVLADTFVGPYTTTADFDGGTKSSSSGNFEVETNTDNSGISANQIELGSVKGDRFTFADADATTWKWTRQGSSNTVCGQSITSGVMRAVFDPALGAKDCAIASNVLVSGNYEIRVLGRISVDGDSPVGQVGRHLCVLDVQVDCSRVADAYPAGVDGFEYQMSRTGSDTVGVALFNITDGVAVLLGTPTFIEPLCRTGTTFCGLRFVKTGASTYEAYYSTNGGETWTLDESVTVSGKPESLYPHAAVSDNPNSLGATTVEIDDYYLVVGTLASGGFRATGAWTTPTITLSNHTVTNITLTHSGLGVGAYIDSVEVLDDGAVVWSYTTDITSGTTTTLSPQQVVSGNVSVRVTFAGTGSSSPVLLDISYIVSPLWPMDPFHALFILVLLFVAGLLHVIFWFLDSFVAFLVASVFTGLYPDTLWAFVFVAFGIMLLVVSIGRITGMSFGIQMEK